MNPIRMRHVCLAYSEDRGSNKVRNLNPEMKCTKLRSLKEYVREVKGDRRQDRKTTQ